MLAPPATQKWLPIAGIDNIECSTATADNLAEAIGAVAPSSNNSQTSAFKTVSSSTTIKLHRENCVAGSSFFADWLWSKNHSNNVWYSKSINALTTGGAYVWCGAMRIHLLGCGTNSGPLSHCQSKMFAGVGLRVAFVADPHLKIGICLLAIDWHKSECSNSTVENSHHIRLNHWRDLSRILLLLDNLNASTSTDLHHWDPFTPRTEHHPRFSGLSHLAAHARITDYQKCCFEVANTCVYNCHS